MDKGDEVALEQLILDLDELKAATRARERTARGTTEWMVAVKREDLAIAQVRSWSRRSGAARSDRTR